MSSGMANDHWRFWLRAGDYLYEIQSVEVKYLDEGYFFSGSFRPEFPIPIAEGLLVEKNHKPLHTFKLINWHALSHADEFQFDFILVYE